MKDAEVHGNERSDAALPVELGPGGRCLPLACLKLSRFTVDSFPNGRLAGSCVVTAQAVCGVLFPSRANGDALTASAREVRDHHSMHDNQSFRRDFISEVCSKTKEVDAGRNKIYAPLTSA